VTVGGYTPDWIKAGFRKVTGINLFKRDKDLFWIDPFRAAANIEEIASLVRDKGLRPTIDNVYPFTDQGVQDAFERIRSRRAIGKVVIDLSGK